MKITKAKLKQIIEEEMTRLQQESADGDFGSDLQALIDRARSQGTPSYEIAELLEQHAEEIKENPDALERRAQSARSSL